MLETMSKLANVNLADQAEIAQAGPAQAEEGKVDEIQPIVKLLI